MQESTNAHERWRLVLYQDQNGSMHHHVTFVRGVSGQRYIDTTAEGEFAIVQNLFSLIVDVLITTLPLDHQDAGTLIAMHIRTTFTSCLI